MSPKIVYSFKFLHKVGATTFHWPRREDVDQAHTSSIFYGPVTVPGFISGPFTNYSRTVTRRKTFQTHYKVQKVLKVMTVQCRLYDCTV